MLNRHRYATVLLLTLLFLSSLCVGQAYNAFQQTTFTAVGTATPLVENTTILFHQLSWSGTPTTCQVSIDSSPDNSAWTVGGILAAQTCTSAGSSAIASGSANYVRVNVSTWSVNPVTIIYKGWTQNPVNGGGTITGVTAGTGLSGGGVSGTVTLNQKLATASTQGGASGAYTNPNISQRLGSITAYLTPGPFNGQTGAQLEATLPRQWVTGTSYYGATSLTAHGDWVSNAGKVYKNAGATAVSGASAPTCSSGTCSDGTITWTFQASFGGTSAQDDFWNYVAMNHDAAGNNLGPNIDVFYATDLWNAVDSGSTGPIFNWATDDAGLQTYLNDPSFPYGGKLAIGIQPVQATGAGKVNGNSATPTYVFLQSYANTVKNLIPTLTTWSTTGLAGSGSYTFGWWLWDGTNYEQMVATGANSICTPGGSLPTWPAVSSTVVDGTCTWKNVGTNAPPQSAGVGLSWPDCNGYSAGICTTGGNTKMSVTCGGYNGATFATANYYNINSACAPTIADVATGLPAIWEPPFFAALNGPGGLYPSMVSHYNGAPWVGLFHDMLMGQTQGVQNFPYAQDATLAATGTTTGQFQTFWGTTINEYSTQIGVLQASSNFPLIMSITANAAAGYPIANLEAKGVAAARIGAGQYGASAADQAAFSAQGNSDSNWTSWAGTIASKVPIMEIQMAGVSTDTGGTAGTLESNVAFAASLGFQNFQILQQDYMALSPNSQYFATFGASHFNTIQKFRSGTAQSYSTSRPTVDPVTSTPVIYPIGVVGGVNEFVVTNATTGNSPNLSSGGTLGIADATPPPLKINGVIPDSVIANYAADTGAVNVYVVTLSPPMQSYATGNGGCFKASATNTTTTPTVNFNGLGAKTIVRLANLALVAGDINLAEPSCVVYDGTNFLLLNPVGTTGTANGKIVLSSSPSITAPSFITNMTTPLFLTSTNCSSSASPAVCAAAPAGSVAVPTGTNPTLVVNTTAVTANSQIFVQSDDTLGTKLSVTCNSTLTSLAVEPVVTARTAATSFTITINGVISTNPVCLSYFIVN